MADPVTAMLVVAGTAEAGKAVMQYGVSRQKLEGLELQRKEQELQYQQKTLANYDMTKKILDTQLAQASTRGISLSSPSLEAIQRDTLNVSSQRQKNLDTEQSILERNARIEKENVQNTLFAELFGDFVETGTAFAGVKSKLPRVA